MSIWRDAIIELKDTPLMRNWFNNLTGPAADLWISPSEVVIDGPHEGETPNRFNPYYVTAFYLFSTGVVSMVLARMREDTLALLLAQNPPPAGFEILASTDPFEPDVLDEDGNVIEIRGDVFRVLPVDKYARIRAIWPRLQDDGAGGFRTTPLRFGAFSGDDKPDFIEP